MLRPAHLASLRAILDDARTRKAARLDWPKGRVDIDAPAKDRYVLLALAGWAAVGLLVAPRVLRRMAQRESGSRVAARRERAMLRAT